MLCIQYWFLSGSARAKETLEEYALEDARVRNKYHRVPETNSGWRDYGGQARICTCERWAVRKILW
jgi:hypothetical protein